MARDKDKREFLFKNAMADHRPDGRSATYVPKDSAAAHTVQSDNASQNTSYTGSKRPTVQSNAPVFQAYLRGGGNWQAQASVDAALAQAHKEVMRLKKPADDACRAVVEKEPVVIDSYTEFVQQYAGELVRSSNLEGNFTRAISTLERKASSELDELIRRDKVRLKKGSDRNTSEVFYMWLQTQEGEIDPGDWATVRAAYIEKQKADGEAAARKRKKAEENLRNAERNLKSSMRERIRTESQIYREEQELAGVEKQLNDERTSESLKRSLTQTANRLRKSIAGLLTKVAGLLTKLKELVQGAISAKKEQISGLIHEISLSNAERMRKKDFDLTA